ncbi:MAG TPA: LemA family protein [Candidatus Woesebacteria bacterium]|nr:LemA family protein [Candidatus Woesebacteria bacterium]
MFGYIIFGILLILAFYVVSQYNWFQTVKTRLTAAIQDIGNQLKRQGNLIPNLETSVKGYLKHEKGIYDEIVSARKTVDKASGSKDMSKIEAASDAISNLVPKLQVLVESNPELKGAEVVTRLMDELRDTSDKLLYARRVVIDLSADYNTKIVTFPSNIIASIFGFKEQKGIATPTEGEHLEVSQGEMKNPKIDL